MSTASGHTTTTTTQEPTTEPAGELTLDGVVVTPERFTLVEYDATLIAQLTRDAATRVGLPPTLPIRVEVDESTPLGRAEATNLDPLVLSLESGALEHLHRPRQLSEERSMDVLGRLLMRVRDRLDPGFGDPTGDLDLTLALSTAWDAYAIGRLDRLGLPAQQGRRRYHFRLRHGFTDRADAIFDRLWQADSLTWADIERLSAEAAATVEG